MTKLPLIIFGLVIGSLVGCAGIPKNISEDDYAKLASVWIDLDYCTYRGWLDPSTSAIGKSTFNNYLSDKSVDLVKLNNQVKWLNQNKVKPDQGKCNQLASDILRINGNKSSFSNSPQIKLPTYTSCTKVGFQTLCNTY